MNILETPPRKPLQIIQIEDDSMPSPTTHTWITNSSSCSSLSSTTSTEILSSPLRSPNSRKRSKCWEFFILDKPSKKLVCQFVDGSTQKICGELLSWCRSTTAMATHLHLKHKINLNDDLENKPYQPNIKKMLINKYPYNESSLQYVNRLNAL
jgi:hypothetical protein